MDDWRLLLDVVVLLGACVVFGGLCSWLKQSPLVGYLLAGMLLGPGCLNVVKSEHSIEAIAELGVALLLFSLGLEFSWSHLMSIGVRSLVAGVIQVVGTTLFIAGGLLLVGLSFRAAVTLGGMISLSSTAAVMRVLADRGDLDSQYGRKTLAILLVQDMAVVPLAILVELMSSGGGATEVAMKLGKIAAVSVALVAALYVILNYVAVRAFRSLSAVQNRELIVLLAIVLGLGSAWSAHAAGLSPALGAFVAGMFLGASPFASQVRADVNSIRIVLLTLFFGAVGMIADVGWMLSHIGLVLAVASAIVVGKTLAATFAVKLFETSWSTSIATGLCLAQVGEFAFVLGGSAREAQVLSNTAFLAAVSGTMVTLFVTPYLVNLAAWVVHRMNRAPAGASAHGHAHDGPGTRVLLIGFGPAGQAVGRALGGKSCHTVVVDVNPDARSLAHAMGLHGEIGDATQWDVMEHIGAREAALIVITLPDCMAAMTAMQHARMLAPNAKIIVRSRYERNEPSLTAAGAHAVVGDERQVGHAIANSVSAMLRAIHAEQGESPSSALESLIGP